MPDDPGAERALEEQQEHRRPRTDGLTDLDDHEDLQDGHDKKQDR
jgi:hypothetical protein